METLSQALPFVSIGTLFAVVVILFVVIRVQRGVRMSLEIAEQRMEFLHEEQDRLAFFREERQGLMEELKNLMEELKGERQERLNIDRFFGQSKRALSAAEEPQWQQDQHRELQLQIEELGQEIAQLQHKYKELAEGLEQMHALQQEADRGRETIMEGLQEIHKFLEGRSSKEIATGNDR